MGFDPTKIGAQFIYKDGNVSAAPAGGNTVVQYNPYRVALFLQAFGGSVVVRPIGPANATTGFNLVVNQQPTSLNLSQHGPLVQQQWNCATAAGVTVYALEVLWQPPGGDT